MAEVFGCGVFWGDEEAAEVRRGCLAAAISQGVGLLGLGGAAGAEEDGVFDCFVCDFAVRSEFGVVADGACGD